MLDDYKKAVISDYHHKKEMGLLSSVLTHPTPAQLRDECVLILNRRPQIKDEQIIKAFFNAGNESVDYTHSIGKFDADKLRPLVKFLKKQIEDTGDKNIELLAWLIDFEPRPYRYGTDYSSRDEVKLSKPIPDTEEPNNKGQDDGQGPPNQSSTTKSNNVLILRKAIPALLILILISGGLYYWRSAQVYICKSGTGKKYHLNSKCPALKNCDNSFVSTSITEAEKNGKTLCGFEIH